MTVVINKKLPSASASFSPASEANNINSRIHSIDILRGLIILLMLVDHVRERFFYHVPISDPINIDTTPETLFFTRLTAHFCAPIFVFLSGLSAWLYAHPANKPVRCAQSFLLKRGMFLIFIELTLINFSWFGAYQTLYLQVIWAIGLSMISLALLCKLPRYWLGIIGALIVVTHNTLTPISFAPDESFYWLWTILHDRGYLVSGGIIDIKISYPVLPWIGVILLGYFCGPLFSKPISTSRRIRILITTCCCCLISLLILRGFNLYGETLAWEVQQTSLKTVMSFLNFTKYPPSLDFLLLTLGIGSALLALFEKYKIWGANILKTFGSAPMFIYVLHLYVLLISYKLLTSIYGNNHGEHFSVEHVWQIWAIALILASALYIPTKYFANFKRTTNYGWIKYF